jgi:membrane fusion protein, multidrug efflux system
MKRTKLLLLIIIIPVGIMSWTLASNKREIDNRKEVNTVETAISVSVSPVLLKEVSEQMELTGTTQPVKEVSVASESVGKITEINFALGDYIAEGKVLARTEDTYRRLAYENAKLNYFKCRDDLTRYQAMREGDAVTETQLRDIRLAYENADIQMKNAQKQLSDTQITSPFSGYVTSKSIDPGAFVNTGSVIAAISDISRLKVILDVSESDAYKLSPGQTVIVTSDVYPGTEYNGSISSVSQKAGISHTYPVEIVMSNSNRYKLKAGTYVNVHIKTGRDENILLIPREAIVSSMKDPSVYQVTDGIAHPVKIITGRSVNKLVEVISGLHRGDLVVTDGQINLADGLKVTIIQ